MRILVAYGSKMGGTRGLADMLGTELSDLGHTVEVKSGRDVSSVSEFDAVIIGGALYYFISWHKDAKTVIRRHLQELRTKPVWMFSSGPLDDSALERSIPPIRSVQSLISKVGARGHVTFGGRLENEERGLPVGDWRNPEHVCRWAEEIHTELSAVGS